MFIAAAAAAKSFQSCPTLCDPTDGSPPGSSVKSDKEKKTEPRVLRGESQLLFCNLYVNQNSGSGVAFSAL